MDAVMKLLEEQPLFVGAAVVFILLVLYSSLAGSASSEKADGAAKSGAKPTDAANGPSKKKNKKPKKKNKKSGEAAGGAASSAKKAVEEEKKEPEEPKPKKQVTIVEEKTRELSLPVEEPPKESKKKKKKAKKKKAAAAPAPVEKESSTKTSEEPVKAEDSDDEEEDDFARILSKKQLEKTVGKSGVAKLTSKQKKEEEKQQEEWVTVNKGSNASAAAAAAVEETTPAKDEVRSETIPLGPDDPALVIGPKGATIQGIQSSSGAKIDVKKAAPGSASSLTITGKEPEIASAKQQIMTLIETAAEEKRLAKAHSVTLSGKDIKGSDGVKSIIGKGGATIKSIQAKTQATIDANVEAGSVVITGRTEEQVQEASTLCKHAVFGESQHVIELGTRSMVMVIYGKDFAKIKQMQTESGAKLDIDRGSTTLKLSGPTEAVRKGREMVEQWMEFCKGETVDIEASKVGAVYGKQGQTIRRIQERTGAFVEVNDAGKKGSEMVPCRIMGEPEAVKEALILFQKAIDGEIELKPGEVLESMDLGVGAPAVIGRGGSKIRELEAAHTVKLKINAESLCNIVGTPENVAKAKAVIEKVIQPLLEEHKAKLEADRLAAQGDPNWGGAWVDDGVPHPADGW